MGSALKAIEALARPPLHDIPQRLRLLADELPLNTTGAVVILFPSDDVLGFGDADTLRKTIGMMQLALHKLCHEASA